MGLFVFSLIFFILTLYFSLKPGRILDWVGKYLTPMFLLLLSILLIATFVKPMDKIDEFAAQGAYIDGAIFTGILDGYNTMDALAYMGATSLGSIGQVSNGGIVLSLVSNNYFGFTGIAAFSDLCKALPSPLQDKQIVRQLISFAHAYLPWFDYGFG